MPTIVLLDTSLSMRRPTGKTNQEYSRHDLACRGIEWFFNYLEKYFPYEYTSFHTFSSTCETLQTFTRDYKQLKEKLTDIGFHDRTDLHAALTVIVDFVVIEWGSFVPCQLLIVTDASPGVKHQPDDLKKLQTNLPFSCKLNVVCIATQEELVQSSLLTSMNSVQRLCDTVGIAQSDIFIPGNPLSAESVKIAFKQLVKTHFQPFSSMLKCGHLHSRVGLTPSPSMYKTNANIVVGPDYEFPRLDISFKDIEFPQEMTVCGFLDSSCIPAPPHYSRHFVLDPEEDKRSSEMDLKSPSNPVAPASENISETKKCMPSFRVLLHGSLKFESKTALLKLGYVHSTFMKCGNCSNYHCQTIYDVIDLQGELVWTTIFSNGIVKESQPCAVCSLPQV